MNINKQALITPEKLEFPPSWVGHIPFASWVVNELNPATFVELGTHSGNSYFAFCQAIQENHLSTKAFAVDTWQGDEHAGRYGDDIWQDVNTYNTSNYSDFSTLLRKTFDEALVDFEDGSVDLLHIDGLHTYEAVKHDFDTWLPKMSDKGVVLFHDTVVKERGFGVHKLWAELSQQYLGFNFIHSHGLGVLLVGEDCNSTLIKLLKHKDQLNSFKELIEALGDKVLTLANMKQAILDRDAQIVASNESLISRDAQIVALNESLDARDGQITMLNQLLLEHKTSTSWRLTAPFRWTVHQVKRLYHLLHILPVLVKQAGGIGQAAVKTQKVFFKEGLSGIKHRIQMLDYSLVHTDDDGIVNRNDYTEWVRRYDTMTDEKRADIQKNIEKMERLPLISVVMPTYNPNPIWLEEAIVSVQNQLYSNWELCIGDDASTDEDVKKVLEKFVREDERIKVVFRKENGHISAASNSALELATGDWVALLDHDDLLPEHALFWVADAINKDPEVRLIYSDEDKLREGLGRCEAYFKSDWNIDLFYSHNMFSHLGVYQKLLLDEVGGFRLGMEGSQDYDLALRCIERINTSQIYHIPRILYHWRVHSESTAGGGEAKPYAMLAGERALNEHFERTGIKGNIEFIGAGYRAHYDIPSKPPLVSLIIPTKNGLAFLRQCVESILEKTTYQNYEIMIVDNDSDDAETLEYLSVLSDNPKVRVLKDDRPFNFSAINNHAVTQAKGELIGLINNDIEVITPDWLSDMVGIARQEGVGAVGACLWYPNDTLQHGGVITGLGEDRVAGHAHIEFPKGHSGFFGRMMLISSFSAVTAACLLIRKDTYQLVGGMNEDLKVAHNDVDFCLKVREAGYRNIWTPFAELYHYESATRGYEDSPEKNKRFLEEVLYMKEKWGDQLLNDPAYNPNLTLDAGNFGLAWPPREIK